MILIHDPGRPTEIMSEGLKTLGLTPAEARLAAALAVGDRLADYAAATGLRPHTVRSTLKAALAKTGTHRQSELVSLVLRATGLP